MHSVPRRSQEEAVFGSESCDPDQISWLTSTACDPAEDMARQEFGPEVSVDAILRRHGGGVLVPAQPIGYGGEVDYSVDLQAALAMVSDAKASYAAAPADIRRRYPTFAAFVAAVQSGFVGVRDVEEAPTPPQRVVVVPDASQPPA